jgi:hypothetical protein
LSLDGNLKNVHIIITGKIETLKEIIIYYINNVFRKGIN